MENNYSHSGLIIQPNETSETVALTTFPCHCGWDDYCWCLPEQPCSCGGAPRDNAPFTFGAVESTNATEQSSTVDKSSLIATENIFIDARESDSLESDATEQHLSIWELPGVGGYRTECTSARDNLCGMFALEISTENQIGIQLTQKDFMDIFHGPEMRAFNEEKNYQNSNNFYDDQLARVVQIWGRESGYDNFQLGVIVEGSYPIILGKEDKFVIVFSEADVENESDFTTIWIHNDNAEVLEDAATSHYSGVTIFEEIEEQEDDWDEISSTEKGSVMETGVNDTETGQGAEDEKPVRNLKRKSSWITIDE